MSESDDNSFSGAAQVDDGLAAAFSYCRRGGGGLAFGSGNVGGFAHKSASGTGGKPVVPERGGSFEDRGTGKILKLLVWAIAAWVKDEQFHGSIKGK